MKVLKQAYFSWYRCFDQAIKFVDFDQNEDKFCVYKKIYRSMVVFLVLCVDDILFNGNDVFVISQDLVIYLDLDERSR